MITLFSLPHRNLVSTKQTFLVFFSFPEQSRAYVHLYFSPFSPLLPKHLHATFWHSASTLGSTFALSPTSQQPPTQAFQTIQCPP